MIMRTVVIGLVVLLFEGCVVPVSKGCGYARSNQKKLESDHRHHRHR